MTAPTSVGDVLRILALTLAACLGIGLAGAWLLHALRRSSMRYQLAIATLVPVVAVVVTVLVNVRFMFLSRHDSWVVLLALAASLLLALAVAYLVLRRIVPAFGQVGAGLDQLIADTTTEPAPPRRPAAASALPQELAEVVANLEETRRTVAESRARERAMEQSRRELIRAMSHDLRTPLAGMRALVEALEDQLVPDVGRALVQLRDTVARMTRLVDDLFAWSRVQGPEGTPEMMVSLSEVAMDVAGEQAATAGARHVRLEVELPAGDRLAVLGAADDLTRALGNLVANAIRHTAPGETVRLQGGRNPDGQVELAVTDTCGGIAEDDLPRVFDPGWRGSASRTWDDGGAGLGLAIARGVVEVHGGQLEVHNVPGGCRFALHLPASG